ncbi:MAG: hypothetical protein J0H52_02555, partial [Comamonadaceae bacterium]|nr:hypothetical protein [Comamonadaceae bacterium]
MNRRYGREWINSIIFLILFVFLHGVAIAGEIRSNALFHDSVNAERKTGSRGLPPSPSALARQSAASAKVMENGRVLYYADHFAGRDEDLLSALRILDQLNYAVDEAVNWADFNQKLSVGKYDLVIALVQASANYPDVAILDTYVKQGGRVIFTDWTRNGEFNEIFEISYTENNNQTPVKIGADSLLRGGIGNPMPLSNPGWMYWSMGMVPTGAAVALAEFPNGNAAIVRGNEGRTYVLGFLADTLPMADGQRFFENLIMDAGGFFIQQEGHSALQLRLDAVQYLAGGEIKIFFDTAQYSGERDLFIWLVQDGAVRWYDRTNQRWTSERSAAARVARKDVPDTINFANVTLPLGEYRFGAVLMPAGAAWLPQAEHEAGFTMVEEIDDSAVSGWRVGHRLEHQIVPGNRAPVIQRLKRNPDGVVSRGQKMDLSIEVSDPDTDPSKVFVYWESTDGG